MIRVLLLVSAGLLAPALGRKFARAVSTRFPRTRPVLASSWHLATLFLWGAIALQLGRPRSDHLGWDNSHIILILLGGLVWVEGWFFLGLRRGPTASNTGGARRISAEGAVAAAEANTAETAPEGASTRNGFEPPSPGFPSAPSEPPRADDGEEKELLLQRILQLERVPVEAIMVRRDRVVFVDAGTSVEGTLERMRRTGRGRLLVVAGDSLDRVLGVAHAKDLAPMPREAAGRIPVRTCIRRALRVPADQSVAALLESFRRDRVHLGVVTDSLSRTLGVVTLADIFRHIAGASQEGSG